jgi:hypothetical protein
MLNKFLKSGKVSYFAFPIVISVAMVIVYTLALGAINNSAISGIFVIIFCVMPLLSFAIFFFNDGKTNKENIGYFILGVLVAGIILIIGIFIVLSILFSTTSISGYEKYGGN